jgi:CRISPR/Cas system-associated exonuclease Cas4 (RecB family)
VPRGSDDVVFQVEKVSPSRLNSYVSCGIAFEKKYVNGEPEQVSGSAALFGNVVHKALEDWALNRQADLLTLMRAAWLHSTEGTSVNDFIGEYQSLASEVVRAEHECRAQFLARTKKESKAIHMSGEWKKHPVKAKLDKMLRKWLTRLEAESPWRFTEFDPLPQLYNESLVLAKRHEARYRSHPNALYTELGFDVAWESFILNGYIDAIEMNLVDGELVSFDVVDYKTYKKESPEAKDWRQGVFYDVAIRDLVARGVVALPHVTDGELTVPIRVIFDYPRLGSRRVYQMEDADRAQLLKELKMYRAGVENGVFLPADKGRNPDFCPYPESCCLRNRGGCAVPTDLVIEAA